MTDWEDIRYFLAVARSGSLSGAARALKVDHATVGRRLSALEASLDVRLIERLPRSSGLTALGTRMFERAADMESAANAIERLAKAARAPLTGRVALSAAPVLVAPLLARRISAFRERYPRLVLTLSAQGEQVSLSRREADVAVRLVRPREADTVARRIGSMPFGLYAHRSYAHLASPEHWQFIAFDQSFADMPQQRWLLKFAGDRPIACELNYISEHLIAALAGVGVAGLPCFLAQRSPDLLRLPDAPAFGRDIWLTVHRDLRKSPPVRAVMDFVTETIAGEPALSLGGTPGNQTTDRSQDQGLPPQSTRR